MFDIDRLHQTDAARTVDEVVFLAEACKLAVEVLPHLSGIFQQVLIEYSFDCGNSSGTGNRIPAECCAMVAWGKQVSSWTGQHCPDRYATPQALCQRHNIGYDTIVFPTEELPGTAHASLHLV